MITQTVPALSFVTISLVLLLGIAIPVTLLVILVKKYGCKKLPFIIGCATFFLFAIILEGTVHSIVLKGPAGQSIISNILMYSLYGGLMAGLFEETGRFIAYKFLIKKSDDNRTALSYGAGHGGFEVFYILFSGMITNLIFSIMINTGNTERLFQNVDEATAITINATLQTLCTTNPMLYLVSIIERIGAVAFHMSASVLVWFAVKNSKRWYLYPLAIILHALVDMITGCGNMLGLPIMIIELFIYIFSALCILLAVKIWKSEVRN